MLNWFKRKVLRRQQKLDIRLLDAKNIRDAHIEIAPGKYFDLFGDPNEMYTALYSDALLTLQVHHILSRSELPQEEYLAKFDGIEVSYIADEIVEAWSRFFSLPLSVRKRILLIKNLQKAQEKYNLIMLEQIGNSFTPHLG